MTGNVNMQASPMFKVHSTGNSDLIIRGKASGMPYPCTFWATNGTWADDGYWTIQTTADNPITASKVDFYNPLTIDWKIYSPDMKVHIEAGQTKCPVYVSLKPPITGVLYHTVVDVACRNAIGQTTENGTVDKIWGIFSGKNVNRWDGSGPLLYWGAFATNPSNNDKCFTIEDLLKYGDGKCGAWSSFFENTLQVHGIVSDHAVIYPKPSYAENDIYPVLLGQGGGYPGKYIFNNHAVSFYAQHIYDASYGNYYASKIAWEDASVFGFEGSSGFLPDTKGVLETIWQ